eukprot:scaffold1886_cov617-Prasinococcus_capsulatus_cf.AAC.2
MKHTGGDRRPLELRPRWPLLYKQVKARRRPRGGAPPVGSVSTTPSRAVGWPRLPWWASSTAPLYTTQTSDVRT